MARYIAPVVTGFLTRNPEVSIDLRTGDVLIDLVQEGYDLAISPVSPPDSTLVKRRLTGWRHVLCCTPAYLEEHPRPRCPADLVHHNCLRYTHALFGDDWPFSDAAGKPVPVRVSGNLITTSIATMRAVTVAGGGLWLSPPFIVADLLASGALVPVLTDYHTPEMEIVALHPHRRHITAKVRSFIDMLIARFADERSWLRPVDESRPLTDG
jgi:DNA-binding transcriptional LysR family regulator